ncbi:Rh173 [macacine betaherpesvirus 3]|nr:Rh173 [macacine betaherpesvirus 3]
MHFRISYLIKDRTIYIFIAILSRYATSNSTSTPATTTNATSLSTSNITSQGATSITSTLSSSMTTHVSTVNESTASSTSLTSTNSTSTSSNQDSSSINTSTTTSVNNSTNMSSPTVSTTSTLITTTKQNLNTSTINGTTSILSTISSVTNTSYNTTTVTPANTTRNSTNASTTAVVCFTVTLVNATIGDTVNLTANYSDTSHHQTTWVLSNKTKTDHELCKTSSSHNIKHHWHDLCYNCNKTTLMLYNVSHNDSGRYVFKPGDSDCSNKKPQAFQLTVTSGNGTSYPNNTPDFCRFTSSAPPTSASTTNIYLENFAPPATHAVWALALVITVVVALMFGQGRMKRMRYYRQRHSDDREELIVKYRPERKRLTTGYEQMYISS